MHLQQIRNAKMSALKGIGVVLALLAVILLVSVVTELITPLVGSLAATILFWGAGIAVALWTMRRFVLTYTYALGPNVLRISFAYGRYERIMTDLYLNNILNAGSLDDMRARYPNARVNRATRPACSIPALAVAARDNGKPAIFLLQPDDTIRAALEETAKKNRK